MDGHALLGFRFHSLIFLECYVRLFFAIILIILRDFIQHY